MISLIPKEGDTKYLNNERSITLLIVIRLRSYGLNPCSTISLVQINNMRITLDNIVLIQTTLHWAKILTQLTCFLKLEFS